MKDVQKYETLIEDIVLESDSLQVTTCHTKAAKYLTLAEIVAKEESEIKGKGIDEFCKIAITYVNLANSDDSVHTLGMKSRKTGKIYLTNEYEVDLNSPIENTDFHYVRDSTTFDL